MRWGGDKIKMVLLDAVLLCFPEENDNNNISSIFYILVSMCQSVVDDKFKLKYHDVVKTP